MKREPIRDVTVAVRLTKTEVKKLDRLKKEFNHSRSGYIQYLIQRSK